MMSAGGLTMTEQQARALLGLPEPTKKPYEQQAHILKPPMPEVTNRPRGKAMGAVSDFLANLDKQAKSTQNAIVDRLLPKGGPNVPFPVGVSLYPTMTSSGEINQPKGLETVPLPLADIAKTIQASDLMGIGGAGRALNEFSYGDMPKDPFDAADMALLAPGIAGLIGAGVRGAKGAGRAVKNLAQSDAGYRLANRVADATGASGLPIIKKGGGNWVDYGLSPVMKNLSQSPMPVLESELENLRTNLNRLTETYGPDSRYTQAYVDFVKQKEADIAERRFADKNLVKYIRNEMGTENDPIRKAIDEGYSHFDIPAPTRDQTTAIQHQRLGLGFPPQGLATTNAGKNWETLSDLSIHPLPAGYRISEYEDGGYFNAQKKGLLEMNPWLAKIPADEQVYELSRFTRPYNLGFDKLLETLNGEVMAGRIDPSKVGTVKMDDLVRITHQREVERQLELAKQLALTRKDLPVVKEYPEGYKWVELNKPGSFAAESDAMEHSVRGYEPDTDHPDWEKISGNAGSPNYGHGGWEAIKSGKAKVYSLIDETGTPHVTVETLEPSDAMRRQATKDFHAREGRYPTFEELEKQNAELPYFATQVKRKFNDVGEFDYPQKKYVTDFMRHKNFNLEKLGRDIENTGLEQSNPPHSADPMENMPGPEAPNWRRPPGDDELDPDPPDIQPYLGYNEGGEVHAAGGGLIDLIRGAKDLKALAQRADRISSTLMKGGMEEEKALRKAREMAAQTILEENYMPPVHPTAPPMPLKDINAHAERVAKQVNGQYETKEQAGRMVAGKSKRQFDSEKNLQANIRQNAPQSTPNIVDYNNHIGSMIVGVPGDATLGGLIQLPDGTIVNTHDLLGVNGVSLKKPISLYGGPHYGLDHPNSFWASNEGPALSIQNLIANLGQEYPVLGQYVKMGPGSEAFAMHNLEALMGILRPEEMGLAKREALAEYVNEMRGKKWDKPSKTKPKSPDFVGFDNPNALLAQARNQSDLRKTIAEILSGPNVGNAKMTKFGLPSGSDVVTAITHPELRNIEQGASGFAIGKMDPTSGLTIGKHPTYTHDIPGQFIGRSNHPIPYDLAFPDTAEYLKYRQTYLPEDTAHFPLFKMQIGRQEITDQYASQIDAYMKRMKQLTGRKKGGEVEKDE
jgi:hypothetical protein